MGTAYPGPKIHYPTRRHLGRGQYPAATGVVAVVTFTGSTATITFARPVTVTGLIPLTVAGLSPLSQTTISPTVVQILFNGTLNGHSFNLPAAAANVTTYQGGPVSGTNGTFGTTPATTTNLIACVLSGAGQYDLTFDQPLTVGGGVNTLGSIVIYSPSSNSGHGFWEPCSYVSQPSADTLRLGIGASDGSLVAVMLQPAGITAPFPFATAAPQFAF